MSSQLLTRVWPMLRIDHQANTDGMGRMQTHLFQEVHGNSSVSDPGNLVWGVEALPIAAEPVTGIGLVVLQQVMTVMRSHLYM